MSYMNTTTLAERAVLARKRAGFDTQEAASKAIGCSRGTVAMWESGGTPAIGRYLYDAAKAYRVRPKWLNTGEGEDGFPWQPDGPLGPLSPAPDEFNIDEVEVIPAIVDGKKVAELAPTGERIPYLVTWLKAGRMDQASLKAIKVRDQAMERTLYEGDRVIVDLSDRERADGKVFAIVVGGPTFRRVFRSRDGGLRLVCDHADKQTYPDELIPLNELDTVFILGRVLAKAGPGGL